MVYNQPYWKKMIGCGPNLNDDVRFKKANYLYFCEMRTIVIKNEKRTVKNKHKEFKLRILNLFLVSSFITSYLYKLLEVIHK